MSNGGRIRVKKRHSLGDVQCDFQTDAPIDWVDRRDGIGVCHGSRTRRFSSVANGSGGNARRMAILEQVASIAVFSNDAGRIQYDTLQTDDGSVLELAKEANFATELCERFRGGGIVSNHNVLRSSVVAILLQDSESLNSHKFAFKITKEDFSSGSFTDEFDDLDIAHVDVFTNCNVREGHFRRDVFRGDGSEVIAVENGVGDDGSGFRLFQGEVVWLWHSCIQTMRARQQDVRWT